VSATPVAAFDFDGTLTRRDTLIGFLRFAAGDAAVGAALARTAPTVLRARTGRLPAGLEPRDAGKEHLLHTIFAGRSADWLEARGARYAETLGGRLRPDVVQRLAWHRDQGHKLVIVSASLQTYLKHFGREHGFDEVIAVELEVDDDRRLTGGLVGPNVRGPEKEKRLRRWLDDLGEVGPLWAYGNSSGDRELLAMARHATLVGRDELRPAP
jgi:phosphatidylglycerophosphatase C